MNAKVCRLLLSIFVCAVWLTPSVASSGQEQAAHGSTEQVVKKCSDAVVLIFGLDSSGNETGLGSGFIVSPDGKIVTNYHVIKDAKKLLVKLTNGAFFRVESILASDTTQDLALIKVVGKNLPTLALSDSNNIRVGERVVAIGSPLGLESTVSDGIVSAIRAEGQDASWIQTTAPVSPGNSGGPLLSMDGKVVGVITFGIKTGQNLNFAAASNEVSALMDKASKPKSFNSETSPSPVVPSGSSETSPSSAMAGAKVWTSLVSGKDYKVRVDGDYLYTELTDLPAALYGTPAFGRGELKTSGTMWKGNYRSHFSCEYYDSGWMAWKKNWITIDAEIEITSMTGTRIEGRSQNYEKGFDCKKGQPKGQPTWKPFTWIPKD